MNAVRLLPFLSLITCLLLGCGDDGTCPGSNTAPAATFLITPASGTTDTTFQYDASGSSDGEDPVSKLQVRWDWENDGTWDTEWSTAKTAEHQYGTVGTWISTLEVKDSGGLTDTTTREVAVGMAGTPPIARFAVTPDSGSTLTGFRVDASGSSDAEDSPPALQVRWDWEDDGTWDSDWSATKTAWHVFLATGTKTIRLEIQDTEGVRDDTTCSVVVTAADLHSPDTVLVYFGSFVMGDSVAYCGEDQRAVTLMNDFYIGRYEVTNQEYRDALQWAYNRGLVTATSSSVRDAMDGSTEELLDLDGGDCDIVFCEGVFTVEPGREEYPVVEVSWYGAAAYCDWLSIEEGLLTAYVHFTWECNGGNPYGAAGYRLPTDAEWEYAAQFDDERIYPWGDEAPDCSRANFIHNGQECVGGTSIVGSYPAAPAELGLHDMAGNVWEWCDDRWVCDLGTDPVIDPTGPGNDSHRVVRGGSWDENQAAALRCATRPYNEPSATTGAYGFRIARTAE